MKGAALYIYIHCNCARESKGSNYLTIVARDSEASSNSSIAVSLSLSLDYAINAREKVSEVSWNSHFESLEIGSYLRDRMIGEGKKNKRRGRGEIVKMRALPDIVFAECCKAPRKPK